MSLCSIPCSQFSKPRDQALLVCSGSPEKRSRSHFVHATERAAAVRLYEFRAQLFFLRRSIAIISQSYLLLVPPLEQIPEREMLQRQSKIRSRPLT